MLEAIDTIMVSNMLKYTGDAKTAIEMDIL
jgi:hypothetical protein